MKNQIMFFLMECHSNDENDIQNADDIHYFWLTSNDESISFATGQK